MISKFRSNISFFRVFHLVILLSSLSGLFASGVQATNPASAIPYVSDISPLTVVPGGQAFTVTVRGANFVSQSVVSWGSTPLITTFVSRGKLTAIVPENLIAAGGTGWITVATPAPGGGVSNTAFLQVGSAVTVYSPTMFSLLPTGSSWFVGHAQGDLNGDGKMDLVALDSNPLIWIFLNNGDGTFLPGVSITTTAEPSGVTVGDINGDGKADLLISYDGGVHSMEVMLGNGNGTFQAALPVGAANLDETVPVLADINGDGKLDILVADQASDHINYYRGNGDGTFQASVVAGTLSNAGSVLSVGDFNGDGILDIAAGNATDTKIALFTGVGDGTFVFDQNLTALGNSLTTVGDFNEDGWLDLAGADAIGSSSSVLLNNSGLGFNAASALDAGVNMVAIAAADLNGDGHADIIGNQHAQANSMTVSLGAGNGTFAPLTLFNVGFYFNGEPITVGNFAAGGGVGFAVNDDDLGAVDIFMLSATLSPSTIDFGNVAINSTPAPQVITITNNTLNAIDLTSTAFSGTNSAEFTVASTTCGATLASSASCTSSVAFTPLASGARSAAFTVVDNAPGGLQPVSLTGTAVTASAVSLAPAALTFGSRLLNSTSATQVVTVKNSGNAILDIASITLAGTNAADFSETNTCGATLAVNATCNVSVTFTPTVLGARTAVVTFVDNALDTPEAIVLQGAGAIDPLTLSAPSLTYPVQMASTPSTVQNVVLTNVGSAAVSISSIAITGTNSADFSQTNNCGVSLATTATCTVIITFTPTLGGARSATLTINDGSFLSPHTVALTGTGQDFTLAISAAQTVTAGASGNFTLTITPDNGFVQPIALTCTDTIPHSTCAVAPAMITPSASAPTTVMLTITTTAKGSAGLAPFQSPGTPLYFPNPRVFELLLLLSILALGFRWRKSLLTTRYAGLVFAALLLAFIAVGVTACGGSDSSSTRTPSGAYTVTVTATSGSLSNSTTANMTVQ